jgi:hypothetical protein
MGSCFGEAMLDPLRSFPRYVFLARGLPHAGVTVTVGLLGRRRPGRLLPPPADRRKADFFERSRLHFNLYLYP